MAGCQEAPWDSACSRWTPAERSIRGELSGAVSVTRHQPLQGESLNSLLEMAGLLLNHGMRESLELEIASSKHCVHLLCWHGC